MSAASQYLFPRTNENKLDTNKKEDKHPMGIMKNLEKMHVAVVVDTFNESQNGIGLELSKRAIAAIMKGFGSPEWKTYMTLFADNPAQLKRLTEIQNDDKEYYPEARAYIVANAVCGAGTTGQTGQSVPQDFGTPPVGTSAVAFDEVDPQTVAARPFKINV